MLASLRFSSASSAGRRYAEPEHPYRNPYQRDRDRIVHSRAFRRLESKTQVFTSPLSDHFRNRLTHTIEVSQITRTVARALGLNEDLAEALALAHDIGHPPFGHAGETALNAEMSRFGARFDHNLHALRVVEQFEQRYAGFPGLNLTYEVREGLVKHSRDYAPGEVPEVDEYHPELLPLLEAQLVDPADEIAYNCADLDDAVEARLLDPQAVRREIRLFDDVLSVVERRHPDAHPWRVFNEALRLLIDALVRGLIEGTQQAAVGLNSPDEVRRAGSRLARLTPETAEASRSLKALLNREVYRSPEIRQESERAAEKLQRLFGYLHGSPGAMPRFYQDRCESEPTERVVCDYIAGMTDKYLFRKYGELIGQS